MHSDGLGWLAIASERIRLVDKGGSTVTYWNGNVIVGAFLIVINSL